MKSKITFLTLLVILFAFGCKNGKNSPEEEQNSTKFFTPDKPNSGGNAGEVEVVMSEELWNSKLGDTVFYYLTIPFPGLPQPEAFYNPRFVKESAFNGILKEHRNILIVKISPQYKSNILKIEHNKWAYNQIVITLTSPDEKTFIKGFSKSYQKILDTLYHTDLMRYQLAYKKFLNKETIDKIEEKYQLSMLFPSSYHVFVDKPNFAWVGRETQKLTQGILIYTEPYDSPESMDYKFFMPKRDTVLKYNVPGPEEGSFMQVEKAYALTIENTKTADGIPAVLVRGLWRTENYFMGGPFVSITFPDVKRARIVHVYAFVYAGKQRKKLYLWQVEAIIRSVKLTETTQEK